MSQIRLLRAAERSADRSGGNPRSSPSPDSGQLSVPRLVLTLVFIEDDLGMALGQALYLKEVVVTPAAVIHRLQVEPVLSEKGVEIIDKGPGIRLKGVDLLLVQPLSNDFDKDAFLGQVLVTNLGLQFFDQLITIHYGVSPMRFSYRSSAT